MWKRQVYQDLAHGVKVFDLFAFESSISGYTCDYVDIDGGSCECSSSLSIFFQAENQRDQATRCTQTRWFGRHRTRSGCLTHAQRTFSLYEDGVCYL
eukprot:COSAG04_NODE_57_length_30587_cov_86.784632_7_plen_97_part_00